MSDSLDARIRSELTDVQWAEFAHSDWVEVGDYYSASEALREVLRLCEIGDRMNGLVGTAVIRAGIARALEVEEV